MAYENSGILSRNDKRRNDKDPEFSGTANVNGIEYWLNGWVKEVGADKPKAGQKFFSLSFRPKDNGGGQQQQRATQPATANDEIPF